MDPYRAYICRWYINTPFTGSNMCDAQNSFNVGVAQARVALECLFKDVILYWTTVDLKRKRSMNEGAVGTMNISSVFLTNIRRFIYPNHLSKYFEVDPPSLEEYLNHRES